MAIASCFEMRRIALLPLLVIVFAAVLVSGCGRRKVRTAKPPRIGSTETGIASWYGHPYHGRRAANGEVYDMERLTAAHRTLPFDTWVRVRNLSNDKTVDVRIQDRGPFIDGRIIDLSRAAARNIDMIRPGIVKVRLTVIASPKQIEKQPELFAVQAGAFRDRDRAEATRARLESFGPARLVLRPADPPVWRVLIGEEETQSAAEALASQIRSSGTQALVVRLDAAAVND
jgi:rare lipoprotein A